MFGSSNSRKNLPTRRSLATLLVLVALIALACGSEEPAEETSDAAGGGGGSSDTQIEVVAEDFEFDTSEVEIDPGSSVEVTLTNNGGAEHTFTSEELGIDVVAAAGAAESATFEVPDEDGSFEFICEFHPDTMKGTIVVGAGGDAPAGGEGSEDEKEDKDDSDGPGY